MIPIVDRYKDRVTEISSVYGEENYLKLVFDIERIFLIKFIHNSVDVLSDDREKMADVVTEMKYEYGLIKEKEKTTNHDIVAVTEHIKDLVLLSTDIDNRQKSMLSSKIHFGLTSQDVVSMANTIMCKRVWSEISSITEDFKLKLASSFDDFRIMGLTHGQKAVPIMFSNITNSLFYRINSVNNQIVFTSRFGGGTIGNLYSQKIGLSPKELLVFEKTCDDVADSCGIKKMVFHQQADYYPSVVESLRQIESISIILEEFSIDMWNYISKNWFVQINKSTESGSSTMSQKVNPISFENAEGNFVLARSMANTIANKISTSRFERDLSDLTVLRNVPIVFGYYMVGIKSLMRGIDSVSPNRELLNDIIDNSYETLAESVNLVLRANNVDDAYDISKDLFKGKQNMSHKEYFSAIQKCNKIPKEIKEKLQTLSV